MGAPLLEAREKELQLVTDTMSVAVVRISRTFTYLWVNRVYAEWVGRKPAEIIGRTIAQVLGEEAMQSVEPRAKELLAGRCISGTHEAHSSYRVMPIVMATGHAAGVTAAIAAREGLAPRAVAPGAVQRELVRQGASLRRDVVENATEIGNQVQ